MLNILQLQYCLPCMLNHAFCTKLIARSAEILVRTHTHAQTKLVVYFCNVKANFLASMKISNAN